MAFSLDVLKGVLDVHAVIAPGGGVDFSDGFEIAEIARLNGRCVGRRPLPTKQHAVVDFAGGRAAAGLMVPRRNASARTEQRMNACTGSGQWDMNPTSFGSLVSGFFIGVAVALHGFVHRVGEEFGSLGKSPPRSVHASLRGGF